MVSYLGTADSVHRTERNFPSELNIRSRPAESAVEQDEDLGASNELPGALPLKGAASPPNFRLAYGWLLPLYVGLLR